MPATRDAPIRLLISDVDRTLLTRQHVVPDRVVEAVRRVRDGGTTVVLASARSPFAIAPIAERLGIPPLMIAFNGAWTGRWGEAAEHATPLPVPLATALAEASEADGADVLWFTPERAHVRGMTERVEGELAVTGEPADVVPGWGDGLPAPGKLLVIARDGEHGAAVSTALRAAFGRHAQIVRSHERLVEITAPGVTKGAAAARLAARLGITAAETAAAGDGENDVALLTWAGLALTVENAIPEVRALADVIGGDCDDGGIADAFEILAPADV
jgi:Cof subfamily protein (haloacid dehalogenase superfamily)